jgi:ATP-dependent DNA ligase
VAKDPESPYVAGRTLKWLKLKQPKYREEEVLQAVARRQRLGALSIFTSFLLDGDYLGPHGTPLAADQVERHDGPLAADV